MANTTFQPREYFSSVLAIPYSFRFDGMDNGDRLLVNEVGEPPSVVTGLNNFIPRPLALTYLHIQSQGQHSLTDNNSSALFDVLAAKCRTQEIVSQMGSQNFTSLLSPCAAISHVHTVRSHDKMSQWKLSI